jgi:flagellar M-ring protein FliF
MNTIFSGENEADDPLTQANQIQQQHRNNVILTTRQILSLAFDQVDVAFAPVFDDTLMSEEIVSEYSIPVGMDGTGIMRRDESSRIETEGTNAGNEPGLQPNTAAFPNYAMSGNMIMSASQREWARDYLVNNVTRVTNKGQGWINEDKSKGSVMAIRERRLYQGDWLAADETRTVEDWRRFKNENANPRLLNGEVPELEFAEFRSLVASAMGLPVGNISLMIMERVIPIDTIRAPWDYATILMVAVLFLLLAMLLYGLLRRQRGSGEDEESIEPQLAVEDLLVSTQLEEAREEAERELEEIDYFKENEIKKHIDKFVNEKPEAVAALLRNWINVEEW